MRSVLREEHDTDPEGGVGVPDDEESPETEAGSPEPEKEPSVKDVLKEFRAYREKQEAKIADLETDLNYWRKGGQPAKPRDDRRNDAPPQADEESPFDPDTAKALDKYLRKHGYVRASEVEETFNSKVSSAVVGQRALERHRDFNDESSPIRKAFERSYEELDGLPEAKRWKAALAVAENEIGYNPRADREARIRAQGDFGRGGAAFDDDGPEQLNPFEREMLRATGMSEKEWRENKSQVASARRKGGRR